MSDSRQRAYQLGALAICVLVVLAVLIVVLSSSSPTPLVPDKPVPGTARTLELLAGIPQQGITLGYDSAPVTLVELGDLQCPYCAIFAEKALPSIITQFVRTARVRLVFRNLDGLGSDSVRAARMAAALGRQNRLWQFIDLAYRNQGEENSGYVTDDFLRAIADVIPGTDVDRAMSERYSPFATAQITQAMGLAHQLKVKVTPSFLLSATGQRPRLFTPSSLESGAFTGPLRKLLASVGG
jgi:protein-disulfide isomerase